MVKMNVVYEGKKHCSLRHEPSQSVIETDAPRDNQGLGERFSPTDLVGAALCSCILTTMALVAERDGLNIEGATGSVVKEMASSPRRIKSLTVAITLPAKLTEPQRQKLEHAARACPVHASLHPDVEKPISFSYA
ncbi:MAG: OsmC family protein [Deltaproteobacteria bacterium]|nr:OsmC family protein [Deltaproteobacteria bacterium]